MLLQDIAALGKLLAQFLGLFADCFRRPAGRLLLAVYVRGLLSSVQRKNVEALALAQGVAVRTLQRFLASIRWDEERLRDRCQQLVAAEHADPEALGLIDETGTTKSGSHTAGVKRQYNGNRGKVENCVNTVALSYASMDFHCLLDARLYLPEEWASDPARRKKTTSPTRSSSKPSRRSRSIWWTVRVATGSASKPGRLTNCTAATASS
jgi:SRSO17 transposase